MQFVLGFLKELGKSLFGMTFNEDVLSKIYSLTWRVILIVVIGFIAIKLVKLFKKFLIKTFKKLKVDDGIAGFLSSLICVGIYVIIGFIIALMRTYMVTPLKIIATLYIECVRGTPLLIQLLFIFYGLPTLASHLPEPFSRWVCLNPFIAGILGLAINYSAYEAEIYRSGFLSVPIGQMEAARALGMTHMQALLHVVFPQAIRTILPPITNDFIMLLQDSSLVSMITIVELSRTYQFAAAAHFDYFGFGILVAAFYLLLGLPFTYCAHRFEKNLARCHRKHV